MVNHSSAGAHQLEKMGHGDSIHTAKMEMWASNHT